MSERNRPLALLVPVFCAVAVSWLFFRHPGAFFYNRYFEGETLVNPAWTLHVALSGWTYQLHLGYANFQELMYPSVSQLLMLALHPIIGSAWLSELYPASIQVACFLSIYIYLRRTIPSAGIAGAALGGTFASSNGLVAGLVHEGYSGMLIDLIMLTLSLLLIDEARRRNRPSLLSLLPLAFVFTGMFKLPEVLGDWLVIVLLKYKDLWLLLRANRTIAVALLCGFCTNIYWAVPMLLNQHMHAFLPVQADTSGEIALSSQAATLSNVTLLKEFGSAFAAAKATCGDCQWYEGAYFLLGALTLTVAAFAGIIVTRSWRLLGSLLFVLIFSTGYHYQDELIGVPYQIVMGLPTFSLFRSAGACLFLVGFFYAVGIALAVSWLKQHRPSRVTAMVVLFSVAVIADGLPIFLGSIAEQNPLGTGANFYTSIPPDYYIASSVLQRRTTRGVTLLLPNAPFANFTWGGTVNDIIPAIVGRPTLSELYWPQPNPFVQDKLDEVTSSALSTPQRQLLMSDMRVDSVLIHDDVINGVHPAASRFGSTIWRSRTLSVVLPHQEIAPLAQGSKAVILDSSAHMAGLISALLPAISQTPLSTADASCSGPNTIATGEFSQVSAHRFVIPICADAGQSMVGYVSHWSPGDRFDLRDFANHVVTTMPCAVHNYVRDITAISCKIPKRNSGYHLAFIAQAKQSVLLGVLQGKYSEAQRAHALSIEQSPADLFVTIHPAHGDRYIAFNESSDPSWYAFQKISNTWVTLSKFIANGYANGWETRADGPVYLVNVQVAVVLLCRILGAAFCLAALYVFARDFRRGRVLASQILRPTEAAIDG